jgi:hypothetical protein
MQVDDFADRLFIATWQGSIAIILIALVSFLGRRSLSSRTRFWLWWVANLQLLVRLLIVPTVTLAILPSDRLQAATESTVSIPARAEVQQYGPKGPSSQVPPGMRSLSNSETTAIVLANSGLDRALRPKTEFVRSDSWKKWVVIGWAIGFIFGLVKASMRVL